MAVVDTFGLPISGYGLVYATHAGLLTKVCTRGAPSELTYPYLYPQLYPQP